MTNLTGLKVQITGIVQGVGFRPFVFNLANRLGLKGWVKNTSAGVTLEVDGEPQVLDRFLDILQKEAPAMSKIDQININKKPVEGFTSFEIIASEPIPSAFQPISPDISICSDCLKELFDPSNRRYRYPFINCTNCGPRFTIIEDIPYDRPKTTMAGFQMCSVCADEYLDPRDRRFHAQPVACADCGPHIWIESAKITFDSTKDPVLETQRLLVEGFIIAIKGLGGFHLACDASNTLAVEELRRRKLRVDKPFALMMPDLQTVDQYCLIDRNERILLGSYQRPIVILKRRPDSTLPASLTPGQDTLGVMLPYTPLHYLLTSAQENMEVKRVLVMTSGNLSEEPIAIENQEALFRLDSLADAYLLHNRPIRTRCDDSVMRISQSENKILPIRRSRGYAPLPIQMPWELPPSLATGTELKNTFCVARGQYAFLSHHIGDMQNYETLQSFEDGITHFERLFRIRPEIIACDQHPDYLATRFAVERASREQVPLVKVQHHHAHIASCMADNTFPSNQPVIGVAFDGTGYGQDGAIWGGEFLLASYSNFQRFAHLQYAPLPGGDAAIRYPARTALAYLWQAGLEWSPELSPVRTVRAEEQTALRYQLEYKINTPLTSSMGRLFDAVAALVGLRPKVNYEAQAAIELEAIADPGEAGLYDFDYFASHTDGLIVDPTPLLKAILLDYLNHTPPSIISARFHNSIVEMISQVALSMRNSQQVSTVILSGGVWQNLLLLRKTLESLRYNGFQVLTHNQVPPNDGGVALGQAVIAYHQLMGIK